MVSIRAAIDHTHRTRVAEIERVYNATAPSLERERERERRLALYAAGLDYQRAHNLACAQREKERRRRWLNKETRDATWGVDLNCLSEPEEFPIYRQATRPPTKANPRRTWDWDWDSE